MINTAIQRMLDRASTRDPLGVNTDWDGTLLVTAILAWERATGKKEYGEFAKAWFHHHREHDHAYTDEEFYQRFTGVRSRIVRDGPVPFTAYCGHWGLGYACGGLAGISDDPDVAAVADAVAGYILHRAARSPHGCVYHDDDADFLIPDTCYFAAPILAIAAQLTGKPEYLEQAVHQLRAYIGLMQDEGTGLAFTLWSRGGMPRSFWSRASGWLIGAIVNTLEYMPKDHEAFEEFASALRSIADGIRRVQREDGGFHVLLDRPDLPTDCTGPAMMALSLRKGIRLGLLDGEHDAVARKAWDACIRYLTPEGAPTRAYIGWAKTAVAGDFAETQFGGPRDFVTGLILLTAADFEVQ